jgi:DNA-directed RNA polymerase specialized sigma24 family protein
LRGASGRRWLDASELAAANQLRRDWETAQIGMVRGSDWSAAPLGSTPRSGANALEAAMARRCDAGRRLAAALDSLAPPLRRVVERVCLHEIGLEALERTEAWPSRSGKLALKLGLAQLAAVL